MKLTSRKFMTAGGCIAVVAALNVDPTVKAIVIGCAAIAYIVIEGLNDNKAIKKD